MFPFPPDRISPSADEMIWNYAATRFPNWINGKNGLIQWYKPTHRGFQLMSRIEIPKGQKRYVVTDRFEFHFNGAMEQVIDACADLKREGKTWITPELKTAYMKLAGMGYAFSAEAWKEGQLQGGLFGIQIGGYVTVESMFHFANHSSKFAYGQLLLRLAQRGFEMLDVNFVQPHFEMFGAQWAPQWKFEEMARPLVHRAKSLGEGMPAPLLPAWIARRLKLARLAAGGMNRLRRLLPQKPLQPVPAPTAVSAPSTIEPATPAIAMLQVKPTLPAPSLATIREKGKLRASETVSQ